uniref:Sosondowah ankyrin repeat domain family member A n=1 Tax=Astyanax mexicanus TaxID=7994 RepID=A0A3B1KKQ5_ASTMX
MDISQEAILSALIEEGGKVRNSELLSKFKAALNCSDPVEKKQNRDLFKTFVNTVAVVKELEETKYIVLKKKYQHLLPHSGDESAEKEENEEDPPDKRALHSAGEEKKDSPPERREEAKTPCSHMPEEQVHPNIENDSSNNSLELSPIEVAFQRVKTVNVKAKRTLQFVVPLKPSPDPPAPHQPRPMGATAAPTGSNKTQASTQIRFALPLRMPPVTITPCPEVQPAKEDLAPSKSMLGPPSSPRYKRRPSTDSMTSSSSPQTRRHCKSVRPDDEPKHSETFPLETTEHEWLVSAAVGHWGLVYGLLLSDTQMTDKKDFITGFTALHWAAKCGNSDMVCKIIELSRKRGKGVDLNAKSFAGYTPLHIAAIHDKENIMELLVKRYGVNCKVRDNCGKMAHHYLHKGVSAELRELLGAPKTKTEAPEPQKNNEELEANRHSHTISRLFQPQSVGQKKKSKPRSSFLSVAEETRGDRDEHSSLTHRVLSDVFS